MSVATWFPLHLHKMQHVNTINYPGVHQHTVINALSSTPLCNILNADALPWTQALNTSEKESWYTKLKDIEKMDWYWKCLLAFRVPWSALNISAYPILQVHELSVEWKQSIANGANRFLHLHQVYLWDLCHDLCVVLLSLSKSFHFSQELPPLFNLLQN